MEAARLCDEPRYREKGLALLTLLKTQVREIPTLGKVLLPGQYGFEKDGRTTLNPSYFPLFLLRRFAIEDAYWNDVFEGCLRATLRSSPNGFAPDWVRFEKDGSIVTEESVGSYNAIRVYLWAGMMSPKDPVRALLKKHFAPMVRLTETMNVPAENVEVNTARANGPGSLGFAACVLPLMDDNKHAALIRTYLTAEPIVKENYYRNVLTLFGLGFDQREFAFDLAVRRFVFQRTDLAGIVEIGHRRAPVYDVGFQPCPARYAVFADVERLRRGMVFQKIHARKVGLFLRQLHFVHALFAQCILHFAHGQVVRVHAARRFQRCAGFRLSFLRAVCIFV